MARLVADLDSARAESAARRLHSEMLRLGDSARTVDARFSKAEVGTREYGRALSALQRALNRGVIDQKEYNRLLKAARERYIDAAKGAAQYGRELQQFGRQMSSVGTQLTQKVTLPLIAVGAASLKMSTDFNEGMANVASLIPGNADRVRELKAEVQDLSISVGKTTDDLTVGLYQTISAFGDTADSLKILDINARAATGGVSTTIDAINLTSAVTKGYGDTTAEAVEKVSDLALLTVRLGQTTFPELAASIGKVTPIAAALGVQQEELFAGFATLTGVTGGAAEVSTQLQAAMSGLLKPTTGMKKALDELGISSISAAIEQRGLVGTIRDLLETTDGSEEAVTKLFKRVESLPAIFALAGGQAETFDQKLVEMGESAGTTDAAFREQTEGINAAGFAMKQAKAEIVVALQRIGDVLAPLVADGLKPAAGAISEVAKAFAATPAPARAVVLAFAAVAAAAGPVLYITGQLIIAWGALATAAPGVAARIALVGKALRTLATGPVGLIATAVIAAASVVNAQFKKMAAESARDIDAMVRDIDKLKGALDDLRAAVRRGVITDDEILAARRSLQPLTMELAEIERKLKFSSDRSEREGLLFRKGTIESEMKSIEGWLAVAGRLPRINEEIEVSAEAAAGPPGGVTAMTDALAEALKGMQASILTQEALRASLVKGGDAYEVLNALLDEGVPLADALSGRYDELARTLLAASTATEELAKNRERLKELAKEAAEAERDLNAAIQETLDSLPSSILGEAGGQTALGFEFDPAEIAPALEAVRNLRLEEDRRRAILQEIGILLREGTITQREAVEIAGQLGVEYSALSEAVAEMGKQAWRNIQDAAAESIVNIFDHYIKTGNEALDSFLRSALRMLAELLVAWAVNAAKRAALEQGVAAAGAGSSGGGGGGAASTAGTAASLYKWAGKINWGSLASSGVLTAAAIAGVVVAWAYWNSKRREKEHAAKFNEVISVTDGGTKIQGAAFNEKQFLELARQAQAGLKAILDAIGGQVKNLPDIAIEAQNSGKLFRAIVGNQIVATVATYEEALELAMLHALRQSDFSGVADEFVNAIKSGAISSVEQLFQVAEVFQAIASVTQSEIAPALDAHAKKVEEYARILEEAGIARTALAGFEAAGYQAIRDQITGVQKSARELFEEQRADFNRRMEERRAELEATIAIEQGKIIALQEQISLYQALIAAGEAAIGISADLANKLATAQAALGAAQAAADAAQTALAGLPDLIGADEFRGGGRGTRRSDLEQLRDLLDQMSFDRALAGMTELEAGRARLARQYEEEARRAHGNADLIAQLADEYAFLNAELTRQIQLAAVDTFQGFLGIGEDPFSGLRDRWEEAREAVEAAGFGAERTSRMLGRLDGAFSAMLDTLSRETFVSLGDTLGGILETYYGNVEGFEQFRMDRERMRFELEMINARAQFEILKAEGTIAEAVLARMAEVFEFIDANPIDWDAFVAPQVPTPSAVTRFDRGVSDAANAAQALADRLARAKESIGEFLAGLDRGEQGGVSTLEGLAAAREQFDEVFSQARGGNIAALEQFPQVAQNLLQLARDAYASSPEFQAIFEMVRASGEALLSVRRVTEDNVVFDERFFQAQHATTAATNASAERTANAVHEGAARTSAAVAAMGQHVAEAVNRQGAEQASRLSRIEQSLNAALAGQQRRKGAA